MRLVVIVGWLLNQCVLSTRSCCQMTQLYEIWERQADRYYEMKRYVDDNDDKIKSVEVELLDMLKNENSKLKRDIKQASQRIETVESELEELKSTVDRVMSAMKHDKELVNSSLNTFKESFSELTSQALEKKQFNDLLEQAKELRKANPPLVAFRVTGTTTTTTADPGKPNVSSC